MISRLLGIMLLLLLGSSCGTKEAHEFFTHKNSFENNWWEYTLWGTTYCFNVYETQDVWIKEENEEHARIWYPWSFTYPNVYTVEGYDFTVIEDGACYEVSVSVLTDTVCGCTLEWEWRLPITS